MKIEIAVLSGDGVGPEITAQAVKVLDAIAHTFDHTFIFKEGFIGGSAIEKKGSPLPKETLTLCVETDAVLLGTVGDVTYDNSPDEKTKPITGLHELQKHLGLYSNIHPIKTYESLIDKAPLKREIIENINFYIFRQLTETVSSNSKEPHTEETNTSNSSEYSKTAIERTAHLAFKTAQKRNKKVTVVDKATLVASAISWRDTVAKIATEYNDVTLEFLSIDHATIQMIVKPRNFDVILTEHMFGDIICNEANVISGSYTLLPSAAIGNRFCMFRPIHGSYPHATGKGTVNPMATILAAAMLLEHFNLQGEAHAIRDAIEKALELNLVTPDINTHNPLTTEKVGDFIADYILNPEDSNINFENIHVGQSTII